MVCGLTALAIIMDTVFTSAYRPLLSEATWADHGWPLTHLSNVGYALMGALIVSRYPRNAIGWLLSAASLLSVTLAAEAYSLWVLDGDGPGSPYWAHVSAWAGPLLGWPAFTALVLVFLISPDGRLASPRWRWAVWVALTGLVLHTLGTLTVRPGVFEYRQSYGNRSVSEPLMTIGYLLIAAALVASAVSLVLRLRRAQDDTRRQLLWIASSAVLLVLGVVAILVVPRISGEEGTWLAALPLRLAQVAVPLCVAVAVLRHRLLQIDLIVNRAVLFALATGLAAAGYVLVVVVVGLVVDGRTTGFWPSLFATAVVALAFQPLRRRVVRVADQLAFGAAAAPYEALAEFSRRLGDSPDPAELLETVADAAAHAVGASRATVLLNLEGAPDRVAFWPPLVVDDLSMSAVEVPVVDAGERLGNITVAMAAGHPLRPREQRLLADLANQAGMAFRHARLTAELSGEVERLAHRTGELDDSRRRLISAGDAERSRLERAIARRVIMHLEPLPQRLRQLSHHQPDPAGPMIGPLLGPLLGSLDTALGALREITRGVFPAQLARSGLPTALASLVARAATGTQLVVEDVATGRRFDPRVEAAAYFCAAEATRDLGGPVAVLMTLHQDQLRLVVTGSDRGDLPLRHMRDRVEATGGSVSVTGKDGRTVLEVWAPGLARAPVAVERKVNGVT